jgi:signal peptidase I
MEPGLRSGSMVVVQRAWCAGAPARGEVWLVEGPEGPALKRVIALPGETLRQREGELWMGDTRLDEPYVPRLEALDAGPWEAGSGYLVLGDNRPESRDSRAWGALSKQAFRGRLIGK